MSGDGNVQFDLVCNTTATMCSQVKKVLFVAGECLNNVIEIKRPIVVSFKYYDFCHGNQTCRSSKLAETHKSIMQLNGTYEDHVYPQALVKQFGPKEIRRGKYSPYDIEISLNADTNFHIVGQVKHTSETIQLLDTVAHEMLHGLGFFSSFQPLGADNLAMPSNLISRKKHLIFVKSIFDSRLYIKETNQPLSSIIDKLNSFPRITTNHTTLLKPPYIETIKELTTLLTTKGSIYFLTINNRKVCIETGYTDFVPGSSVSHLDRAYGSTIEHIMIPSASGENGLDSISRYIGWYTAPYGPLTLEVLATLGYTMKQPTWGHSLGGIVQLLRQEKEDLRIKGKQAVEPLTTG
ncbi:hypothetical protein DSO57_1027807 [Entomophthora muscae]|uniref:Uncharacterized protein n=1 Tax=Entomophthora muscae TaxID=34485 RepID=A0ACC2TCY2_9FUNG|nr:hypothetical protein DSO57_1027807 [Entomophthora muscae]